MNFKNLIATAVLIAGVVAGVNIKALSQSQVAQKQQQLIQAIDQGNAAQAQSLLGQLKGNLPGNEIAGYERQVADIDTLRGMPFAEEEEIPVGPEPEANLDLDTLREMAFANEEFLPSQEAKMRPISEIPNTPTINLAVIKALFFDNSISATQVLKSLNDIDSQNLNAEEQELYQQLEATAQKVQSMQVLQRIADKLPTVQAAEKALSSLNTVLSEREVNRKELINTDGAKIAITQEQADFLQNHYLEINVLLSERVKYLKSQPFITKIGFLAASIDNATTQEALDDIAPQVETLKKDIKTAYPGRRNSRPKIAQELLDAARNLENEIALKEILIRGDATQSETDIATALPETTGGIAAQVGQAPSGLGLGAGFANIITGAQENIAAQQAEREKLRTMQRALADDDKATARQAYDQIDRSKLSTDDQAEFDRLSEQFIYPQVPQISKEL